MPTRALYFPEGAAEKIENITTKYGYWSTTELWKFDNVTGNSTRVPFDAHELVALVAPVRTMPSGWVLPIVVEADGLCSGRYSGTRARRIGG